MLCTLHTCAPISFSKDILRDLHLLATLEAVNAVDEARQMRRAAIDLSMAV
jgi:hypothetical protein